MSVLALAPEAAIPVSVKTGLGGRLLTLTLFCLAALVATACLGGLLSLVFGHLPAWVWWALALPQLAMGIFLAAATFVGGEEVDCAGDTEASRARVLERVAERESSRE